MKLSIFQRIRKQIILICALYLLIFHFTSALFGAPNTVIFKHIHLEMMIIIVLMQKPFLKNKPDSLFVNIIDFLEVGFMFFILVYIGRDLNAFIMRAGSLTKLDVILGTIYILILCDAGRRVVGWVMIIIAAFFVGQNLISDMLPGIFYGPRTSYTLMVDYLWIRANGIFSDPVSTIASYVVFFLIFAALLSESGAGTFFIKISESIAGRFRGGPAKVAVISSGMFGSISGSSISNVAGTGAVTIPLMKSLGYENYFAGAVEAVASTGGQIMPPMMGAAAFIMASTLQTPYIKIALYALIPALLYYLGLFFQVDFRAAKLGLVGMKREDIPNAKQTLLEGGHLVIPIIAIVVLLAENHTPQYGALMSTLILVLLTFIKKWTRMSGKRLMKGCFQGILDTASIAVTAGVAGLIIGGITSSGLGLIFAQKIMSFSGGNLGFALVLVAIASLLLGMGMTTVAVYLTVATVMAPALTAMGVMPLAAHMFVFYFGIIGTITPPVALTAFTAAGLAGSSPSKTGWTAFRLGIAGYIVPFMFVYGPALLCQGSVVEIIRCLITASIGCIMLAGCAEGWLLHKANVIQRIIMAAAALLMIDSHVMTDLIGLAVVVAVYLWQKIEVRNGKGSASAAV